MKPLRRFSGPWVWKNLNKDNKCQKNEKIASFVKKMLKFVMLKTIPLPLETMQQPITKPQRGFLDT